MSMVKRARLIGFLAVIVALPSAARAAECLEAGSSVESKTTLIVLNFAQPGTREADVINQAFGGDPDWEVRPCADFNLWRLVEQGNSSEIDVLLRRRVVIAVSVADASVKHHVLPFDRWSRSDHLGAVQTPALGLCKDSSFDFYDAGKRYKPLISALKATAATLYRASFDDCPSLRGAERSLTQALAEIARLKGWKEIGDLSGYVANQSTPLQVKLASKGCQPRELNQKLSVTVLSTVARAGTEGR
jgi:hypothetical protein